MEVLHDDGNTAIHAVDNVLVVGWLGSPNLEAARALDRTTRQLGARHPRGIAHLNLVTHSSRPSSFEDDARKIIVGMLHDKTIPMIASTTVFGGGGFVAATIRGVLASLTMLSRTDVRIRFVGTLLEGETQLRDSLAAARAHVPAVGALVRAGSMLQADADRRGYTF